MAMALLICLLALGLDLLMGEPRRWHPLVGLGWCADRIEAALNPEGRGGVLAGGVATTVLVLPVIGVGLLVEALALPYGLIAAVMLLWLCIGYSSLADHGMAVYQPLVDEDLQGARDGVGMMVSRDTRALDETGIATAATESLLENGADAIFASLFWFLVAGLPGLLLHRTVNTLDAMWGYRTDRFNRFGRVAARLDDVLNWIPARLTALSYALAGQTRRALRCWRTQARAWESPNAGPVMAGGAGALGVQLGGRAPYHGGRRERSLLGDGGSADVLTIPAAIALIQRSLVLWMAVAGLVTVLVEGLNRGVV